MLIAGILAALLLQVCIWLELVGHLELREIHDQDDASDVLMRGVS